MPLHETEVKKLLEHVNLLCDSAWGYGQFFGGGSDAPEPAHYLEGLDASQGWRSGHALDWYERKLWRVGMDLV